MKKLTVLALLLQIVFNCSFGQDNQEYAQLIKEAWSFYQTKEYLKSAQNYSRAFITLGGKGMVNDRYNAACSWALAGQPDSSFVQLFKIAENGNYNNLDHITSDPDLNSLHQEERWEKLIEIVTSNKEKAEANLDKPLVALLDTIHQDDQQYRQQMQEIEKKHGWNSDEMEALRKIIIEKDAVNLIKVKKILDERGWLGPDVVGNRGNQTLFLVIQHADLATQEQYLPMMREAVQKGNAQASSLALMEDRVALRQGKKQIYGSQIGSDQETGEYYVSPMIDPENVDKRRVAVGLEPIKDYLARFGMTWDVEAYMEKLPDYEAKERK